MCTFIVRPACSFVKRIVLTSCTGRVSVASTYFTGIKNIWWKITPGWSFVESYVLRKHDVPLGNVSFRLCLAFVLLCTRCTYRGIVTEHNLYPVDVAGENCDLI